MHSRTEKCNAIYLFRFLILYPYQLLLPTGMYRMLKLRNLEETEGEKRFVRTVFPFLLKTKLWVRSDTCGFSSRFGFCAAGGVTVRFSVCFSSASTCGLIV